MSIRNFSDFLDEKKKVTDDEKIKKAKEEIDEAEEELEDAEKALKGDVEEDEEEEEHEEETPKKKKHKKEESEEDEEKLDIKSREAQDMLGALVEVEHKPTYIFLKEYMEENSELPPAEEFYQHISDDHLEEKDDYYTELIGEGIADEEEAIELYNKLKKKK